MEGNSIREMISMAKVYDFPVKRKLPAGMERDLHRVANDYIAILKAIMVVLELESNPPSYEEVLEMVSAAFAEGIYEAIDNLDES
jgi:hypothetical protein